MLPRMFTAWPHGQNAWPNGSNILLHKSDIRPYENDLWHHGNDKGNLYSGTFLKTICLLPYLKNLGTDVIYLLPVFKYSDRYKKGEIGSPYSIKDIYNLDKNLHDPLCGEYSNENLETQFKAFVEACHILDIRVMVDYVFRTVARDSHLIVDHPDWFYWIDKKFSQSFAPLRVEGVDKPMPMDDNTLGRLYTSKGIKGYLAQFVPCPRGIDPDKWTDIVRKHRETGENILDLIETEFGITTLPGFVDVVNDNQPPWTDVTYLKFYFDVHEKAKKYVPKDQAPYIMQDGVKLGVYPGKDENTGLMEYIAGVIPYYQDKFGIDGARIDMAHALPPKLNSEIIRRVKEKNRNFILWSEEFDPSKSDIAKENGFHFINGYIWSIYKYLEKPSFNKRLFKDMLIKSEIPVVASLETPDTPRAANVHKSKAKMELLVLLNSFLPNAVQFINNGFEMMEIQPMNLGLDNSGAGAFVLEKDDPRYGKLAFFDNFYLNWLDVDRKWMEQLLIKAQALRRRFLGIISKKENYIEQPELYRNRKLTCISYFDSDAEKGAFLLANRNFSYGARFNLSKLLPEELVKGKEQGNIVYINGIIRNNIWELDKNRVLKPGEIIIGEVNHGQIG
ncbi:MAG: alpha amylase [Clostridiales bacterium]|nr:alpha amylase [Clostridiales bacterium]